MADENKTILVFSGFLIAVITLVGVAQVYMHYCEQQTAQAAIKAGLEQVVRDNKTIWTQPQPKKGNE